MPESILYSENFDAYQNGDTLPEGWWVEGGEKVWIEDGHIRVKADPPEKNAPGYVCTVWYNQAFSGNVQVDFDARVLSSTINSNNINFFLFYTDPNGRPLLDTKEDRADGAYRHYHALNGYIFTFLNAGPDKDNKARMRMRRCPGFELLTETYDYHCRENVTYHVTITRKDGQLTLAVDGTVYLKEKDPDPWPEGLIGLRTYHTDLWYDMITVKKLE